MNTTSNLHIVKKERVTSNGLYYSILDSRLHIIPVATRSLSLYAWRDEMRWDAGRCELLLDHSKKRREENRLRRKNHGSTVRGGRGPLFHFSKLTFPINPVIANTSQHSFFLSQMITVIQLTELKGGIYYLLCSTFRLQWRLSIASGGARH